jgi:hypothetical protein
MAFNEQYASNLVVKEMYEAVNTLDHKSCWHWDKAINKDGYGITSRMIDGKKYGILTHRLSWFTMYGNIPDGMAIDHMCHEPASCVSGVQCEHRRCYNPYHLKMTTLSENTKRGANNRDNVGMCRNNLHEWVPENQTIWGNNKKVCKPCHKETSRRNIKKAGA